MRKAVTEAAHARRPGEGRDPYAAATLCGTLVNGFRNNNRQWLWVPAFAGTTGDG